MGHGLYDIFVSLTSFHPRFCCRYVTLDCFANFLLLKFHFLQLVLATAARANSFSPPHFSVFIEIYMPLLLVRKMHHLLCARRIIPTKAHQMQCLEAANGNAFKK